MVYLDNAATTMLKPASVAESMARAVNSMASPGRGGHSAAMYAADTLFECRETAARLFKLNNPENVVFTMNATHALNIAIKSLVKPGKRVIVSGYEHNSVMRPLYAAGADVRIVRTPLFDRKACLEGFKREIRKGAALVVCTHISNVFGFILPVQEISALCWERKIPFILDASQSAGAETIDFSVLGATFIAMPGHKGLYGPQGTGLLLCRTAGRPILQGGTGSVSAKMEMPSFLPDRLEAGTHNMPGITGLLEGLRFIENTGERDISEHEKDLINLANSKLSVIPGITVFYTDNRESQGGVLSFNLSSLSSEDVSEKLGELGIATRAGLHCSPNAHTTAGTISAGTVRISVSAFNTDQDIYALAEAVRFIS